MGTQEIKNRQIAEIFRQIAKILEIQSENPFRIRAYLKAAQNIESLNQDIDQLIQADALEQIPGIGRDLAGKIKEIAATGKLQFFEQLKAKVPEGLTLLRNSKQRMLLIDAAEIARKFISPLEKLKSVQQVIAAGSLRRKKETVRDIDILVSSAKPEVSAVFTGLPEVKQVLVSGPTKSSILTDQNIQVDLRVVKPVSFGAALLYFTGSKEHNIKLRREAIQNGLKLNEYGVFKNDKCIAGKTEKDIFNALKLSYIPPELREDSGEIEAAKQGKLPKLVELADIKGDLHSHTNWSDGNYSLEQMAGFARAKGYQYLAVTDHSQSLKVAGGLSAERIKQQIQLINKLNKQFKGFYVLSGAEVDIKSDGSLDYPDSVLKQFDIVVAAIHNGFKQDKKQLTHRITRAMENKYVNIVAHPTGRLLNQREPYQLDMEAALNKALNTHTFMELSAFSNRLDLTDLNCRRAKQLGVKVAISTDSHAREHLDFMHLGVSVARRGWLEKKDVINTLPLEKLIALLSRKRKNG